MKSLGPRYPEFRRESEPGLWQTSQARVLQLRVALLASSPPAFLPSVSGCSLTCSWNSANDFICSCKFKIL